MKRTDRFVWDLSTRTQMDAAHDVYVNRRPPSRFVARTMEHLHGSDAMRGLHPWRGASGPMRDTELPPSELPPRDLAERVLDAPGVVDDFYASPIAWSSTGCLALATSDGVSFRDPFRGAESAARELNGPGALSVAWRSGTDELVFGTEGGAVCLWNTTTAQLVHRYECCQARVGIVSVSADGNHIAAGSSNCVAVDCRTPDTVASLHRDHAGRVCGLAWSPDGNHLAIGDNDNALCLWDARNGGGGSGTTTTIGRHTGAVKALAWCPYDRELLASGGGREDGRVKFWRGTTQESESIETGRQITSIVWGMSERNEILTTHGFPLGSSPSSSSACVWQYPRSTVQRPLCIPTPPGRILQAVPSPDGTMVAVVIPGTETLHIWSMWKRHQTTASCTGRTGADRVADHMRNQFVFR
jgi:cell division cycle 20, cofactor of APC complex